ncbi:hypothetical protein HanIR_Chr14g0682961 [Helianthus annuus]|nr:hypothetical protein HanIR_Chr14g0682961 [Helianthus annuus]
MDLKPLLFDFLNFTQIVVSKAKANALYRHGGKRYRLSSRAIYTL